MLYPSKLTSLLAVEGRGGGGWAENGRKPFPFLSSACPPHFLFCIFMPRATFVLATLDLKGTDTTATQATSSCERPFNLYIFSGHLWNLDSLKRRGTCFSKGPRTFFKPEGKFSDQNMLNSSTVPSSQTCQFCLVN